MLKSFSAIRLINSTPEKKQPLTARIQTKLNTPSTAGKSTKSAKPSIQYFKINLAEELHDRKRTQTKEKAIVHEVKLNRKLLFESSMPKEQVKRDPILQNNGEKNIEPPRVTLSIERTKKRGSKDEPFKRQKKAGDFNFEFNPPNQDPKPEGIRAFVIQTPECRDEKVLKMAAYKRERTKSTENLRSPITEGDEIIRKFCMKQVDLTQQAGDSQWINERKFLLKSERGRKSSNPHLATCFTLGDEDYEPLTERSNSKTPNRPITAIEQKIRGCAKGILEYESGPNYRDVKMTDKCTTVKFSDLKQSIETERIFARVRSIC